MDVRVMQMEASKRRKKDQVDLEVLVNSILVFNFFQLLQIPFQVHFFKSRPLDLLLIQTVGLSIPDRDRRRPN